MSTRTAFVLLVNQFADWEAASAMAELQRTFRCNFPRPRAAREEEIAMYERLYSRGLLNQKIFPSVP
jgi:hypothetical protein